MNRHLFRGLLFVLFCALTCAPVRADAVRASCTGRIPSSSGSLTKATPPASNAVATAPNDTICREPSSVTDVERSRQSRTSSMQWIAIELADLGLCCSDYNLDTGMTCRGRISGYPKDVVFFVPADYRPEAKAQVILNLHGLLLGKTFDSTVLDRFHYESLLKASGRNAILVLPENTEDYDVFLKAFDEHKGGFNAFMDGVNTVLEHLTTGTKGANHVASITLTAHSAGNRAVEQILGYHSCSGDTCYRGRITEVHLFDASYGIDEGDVSEKDRPETTAYMNQSPPNVFTDAYLTDGSSNTVTGSLAYENAYCRHKLGKVKAAIQKSCVDGLEKSAEPGPLFIGVDGSKLPEPHDDNHWKVLSQTFGPVLSTHSRP